MLQFSIEDLGTFEIHGDPSKVYLPSHFAQNFLTCLEGQDLTGKRVLDLGCGTGVIGIAAAKKGADVVCLDINRDAVDITLANATLNRVKLEAYASNGFEAIEGRGAFDLIICNAPTGLNYVDDVVTPTDNGEDGRAFLDYVLAHAAQYLSPNGRLLTCTGSQQGWEKTERLIAAHWSGAEVVLERDEDVSALKRFPDEALAHWVASGRCWVEGTKIYRRIRYFFAQM